MSDLTQSELKEYLDYDADTGVFIRKAHPKISACYHGKIISKGTSHGYVQMTVKGKKYRGHRLAWLYFYGAFPLGEIDHINGKKDDNRIDNLRDVTRQENCQNLVKPKSGSVSRVIGVTWIKATGRFRASIGNNGDKIYIGTFNTKEEAHSAYVAEKRRLHWVCQI